MAFYGSASANLSPILFKGNLFSEGVNVLMHSDISLSMNVPSNGPLSYRTTRPATRDPQSLGVGYTNSMFYDGLFPAYLQKGLIKNKVGDSSRSPNLFGYFDATVRSVSGLASKQSIVENTETYEFTESLILATNGALGNLRNSPSDFVGIWTSRYINNVFSSTNNFNFDYPFNVAAKQSNTSEPTRLLGVDSARSDFSTNDVKLSYYSEDVHGNILSIYYSGLTSQPIDKKSGVEITIGDISKSHFGSDLYKIPRRKLPTYFITASNEQENAAANAIGVGFTTKTNVGYSTDKYGFNSEGVFIRRYRGCIGQPIWNSETARQGGSDDYSKEIYKDWFNTTAVPLPYGADDSGYDEDRPGVNWFNGGSVFGSGVTGNLKFAQKIGGFPEVSYYILTGSGPTASYNYDSNYASNTSSGYSGSLGNIDFQYSDAFVPEFLKSLTQYPTDKSVSPTTFKSITNENKIGALWGPLNSFDRVRSDIENYTLMSVGYFRAPATGLFKFKIITCGVTILWMSSDRVKQKGSGGNGWVPATGLTDDKVYNNWLISESTVNAPTSPGDRWKSLHNSNFKDVVHGDGSSTSPNSIESNYLEMVEGRYYPFRIVFTKPNGDKNDFVLPNSVGDLSCDNSVLNDASDENPGFFRLLFTRALTNPPAQATNLPDPLDSDWNLSTVSGNKVFYGGKEVWKTGSPFFPLPQTTVTTTVQSEITNRNIRVIALSSYDSNDSYDGVFFLKKPTTADPSQLYRYINLSVDNYSIYETTSTSESPSSKLWRFKNYFQPITYSISSSDYIKIGTPNYGENAVLNVARLNDRYLTTLANSGNSFKIGDRLRISGDKIGGSASSINDLLIEVNNVIQQTYTSIEGTVLSSNRTDNASFFITKNANGDSNPEYSIEINPSDAGSDYAIGDELVILGGNLDGQSPQHDLTLKVTNIGSNGEVTGVGLADGRPNFGSPTDTIEYTASLNEFVPINYSSIKFYNQDCNIYYRNQSITGVAYTTANITGISYTTLPVTGIAYSSFNLSGIAYTTASIVSIGYSTANISGIAYTTRSVVSAGYTAAIVTGIAYTTANVVSIGYTTASVTAIGYTAPNIVSIGYTAFEILDISYPNAISITSYEDITGGGNDNTILTVSTDPTSLVAPGGFVIISDTGNPLIDGRREVAAVTSTSIEIITSDIGNNVNVSTSSAKLIIEDDGIIGDPVGVGSTALLTTSLNHTFNSGDSIVIRGIDNPSYSAWNSTFKVQGVDSPNAVWLENTGTVGLFTATSIGTGSTVGYDQAELELTIGSTIKNIGITSIAYDLTNSSRYINNSNYISGPDPDQIRIITNGSSVNTTLSGGQLVYFFETNSPLDYNVVGYGHTVINGSILSNRFEVVSPNINGPEFFVNSGYWILETDQPIVKTSASHSFANNELVKIVNNQNSVYNNTWRALNVTTDTFRLGDPVTGITSTANDLITISGNTNNLSGIASASTAAYKFEVGMGITVFGVTGTSAIYNDGYVISGIKSSITEPYAFILKENQTPSQLALPGTNGKIGIHTLSGIATVSSTIGFGDPGQLIDLKIENSTSSFFNKVFTGARILDGTRILLGSDSHRNLNTQNPEEYSKSDANVSGSTLSGRIGSSLGIVYNNLTPGYTLKVGDQIDVYGSTPSTSYNTTSSSPLTAPTQFYTITSIKNPTTFYVDKTSGVSTSFSTTGTNGTIGIRGLPPIITLSTSSGLSTNFGAIGKEINISIKSTSNPLLNNAISAQATVVGTNTLIVPVGASPFTKTPLTNYDPQTTTAGIVGLVGSRLRVITSQPHEFLVNNSIRLQNITDQFGSSIFSGTYTVSSVPTTTTFDTNLVSNTSTNFGLFGFGGLSGLIADAVVNTEADHPFVTGDTVKLQNTLNSDFNNLTYTIKKVDSRSFILNNSSASNPYTDDFTTAGASSGGIAGLLNYPATVTYTTPSDGFIFETGQKVQIENTTNTYGISNNKYTITKVTNNSFKLNVNADGSTDISKTDSTGRIGLLDSEPTVTYTTKHRIINTNLNLKTGDQVKIQGTGNANFDNNVYTVKLYQNGTPVDTGTFGLIGAEKSSTSTTTFDSANASTGIGGLVGSKLRLRTGVAHELQTGNSIRIQGTSSAIYDGNSSVNFVSTDIVDLNNFVSDSNTNFTPTELSNSSARIGIHGYPAIATCTSLPSSFITGSQVRIQGSTTYFNTSQVYTITRYSNTTFALQESTIGNSNPTSITFVESSSPLIAGLRNSPARINVGTTTEFGSVGSQVSVDVSGLDSYFNGVQLARITSSTTFDLINKTNPDSAGTPLPYSLSGIDVTGGVIGLRDASRVVSVPTGHGLQNPFTFYPGNQIYIRSTGGTYSGTFVIEQVLDLARFTIDTPDLGTNTQNPVNYSLQDTGYYVGVSSGARVVTSSNHILNAGDSVTINDDENDFDGTYTVQSIYSPTEFSLNSTYPTTNLSTFDFKKQTVSGNVVFNRTGTAAQIKVNRNINSTYTLPSTFISNPGSNYRTGHRYLVKGGKLGGSDGTNDLTVTVGSVLFNGLVYNVTPGQNIAPTLSGTADNTLDYSIDGVFVPKESTDNPSSGSGARFTVVRSGLRNSGIPIYTSVNVTSTGSQYSQNDKIKILGTDLGGFTPQNDLYVSASTVSSGQLVIGSSGIAYTGIASDSYPIAGFSTIYIDGTTDRSRPYGLEKVWDHTLDGSPPSEGGFLFQKQDMLTLAAENYGGLIKIDKVFNIGSPEKSATISTCFFYGYKWQGSNADSTIIFDRANSGICSIFMDNDGDDDEIFYDIVAGVDKVFILNSRSTYPLDYNVVGYAHTVIAVQSAPDNAESGNTFDPNLAYNISGQLLPRDIDYITIQTNNDNVVTGHNRIKNTHVELIRESSPLIIVSNAHPFLNGDVVNLYKTTNLFSDLYESNTGLAFTSYVVRNAQPNSFELSDTFGNTITAGTISPGGKPLIEYVFAATRSPGGNNGPNNESEEPRGVDSKSAFTRFYPIKSGQIYCVGTGIAPVDNRLGLTKAIADFISQTSKKK